jgi:hypothetical protein
MELSDPACKVLLRQYFSLYFKRSTRFAGLPLTGRFAKFFHCVACISQQAWKSLKDQ